MTEAVRQRLIEVFETDDFEFWICASGTASNALALSCFCPPTGAILCHADAHIAVDERGAPEFFTGGGKLQLLPGASGKIAEPGLRDALTRINPEFVHETPAHVLSLTNLTESGCAYTASEITHYAALAHHNDLVVHLDGARLANALVSTDARPAEMTWQAGVDVLTFGLTKTGAIGCEIILLFGKARQAFADLQARAKRSGHMPPKMRFLAAQALALLEHGLWLDLAASANQSARQVSNILCTAPGVSLTQPVDGNEVFAALPPELVSQLTAAGAKFYPWPDGSYRLVCSWATSETELEALRAAVSGKT
ncbi:MAG: beta-eliminating lyase-related protein [Pseudomonadota bacterium]